MSDTDYQNNLALFEALIAGNPRVDRKGATMPYTSRNGHMFSFLDKSGVMALRLPDTIRETFLKDFDAELSVQYGKVMKEYVNIPANLLRETDRLQTYFDLSYEYIGTLKPKATTRPKKSK